MKGNLISCIMPTYNRRAFVPHAIRYFLRQDYQDKELIIIDDGTDPIEDLVPSSPFIRYYRLNEKIALGAKLNLACRYANGNLIVHWDDDDWYAPHRISYQVDALQDEKTYICGINRLLYFDLNSKNAFQYIYPPEQRTWLLGSSLCYKKGFWEKNAFAEINVGMDGLFVWKTTKEHVHVMPDHTFAIHMIHEHNVSPKKTEGIWWHDYPVENIARIMNGDWECYNERMAKGAGKINLSTKKTITPSIRQNVFKNIFACLVHEKEECILDLVQNLHHQDPNSIILLYNGASNPALINTKTLAAKYGVVVHPDPVPVRWGYLHDFALKCMEFCLDNFEFDTLTVVDSDQLCLRKGYSEYISAFMETHPSAGMLSSHAQKINPDQKTFPVAIQAFREYELWKPFLQCFPNGIEKFVHWTFWPSSVFTAKASKELVQLFRQNEQLKEIMRHTKIWATEEVILPTLVRLMGFDIVQNPCSYDFVRYKQKCNPGEIQTALEQKNVYWIHPIERQINDSLRSMIRNHFNNYHSTKSNKLPQAVHYSGKTELINTIRKIEGWLSDKEAGLLIDITLKTCNEFHLCNIVETGSYHGKSTILFGSIIKNQFHGSTIYALDTHDGKLGAADTGLVEYPPSYDFLMKNIATAQLSDVIRVIRSKPCDVDLNTAISLLFLDGLHDYENVLAEFSHFSPWLIPGGHIAFHDYASYYPGVQRMVNEQMNSGKYKEISRVDSLIILQKQHEPYTAN